MEADAGASRLNPTTTLSLRTEADARPGPEHGRAAT